MSIYKKFLGSNFEKLHPKLQQRYGLSTEREIFIKGTGIMTEVRNAGIHVMPFLHMGTASNLMFPETGTNIPFTIENYCYKDSYGRETVSWTRKFDFGNKIRRFDETMIYSEKQKVIRSYLGNKQHLVATLHYKANDDGSLSIHSGPQHFYEDQINFNMPGLFSGIAEVHESYNEKEDLFHISIQVRNKTFGAIFGYKGFFKAEFKNVEAKNIPAYAKPLREEIRE